MIDLDNIDIGKIDTAEKLDMALDVLSDMIVEAYVSDGLSMHGREVVSKYVSIMGIYDCVDAMRIAIERIDNAENAIKYFIGICKNWIKNGSKPDYKLTTGGRK